MGSNSPLDDPKYKKIEPFFNSAELGSRLASILDEFELRFGYTLEKANSDLDYLKFHRTVSDSDTPHELVIEDHRWELKEKDFDPQKDIGDWLIFSYIQEFDSGWWYEEKPYPLTYSEYKMIEKIIKELENRHDQETDQEASGSEQSVEP